MTTINDEYNIQEGINEEMQNDEIEIPAPAPTENIFQKIWDAETGAGTIEDYLEHPLNFNKTKYIAKIIRGFSGILGNLNKAIIDIVFGLIEMVQEKRKVVKTDEN